MTKLATDLASGERTIGGGTTTAPMPMVGALSRRGAARLRIIRKKASTPPTRGTTTAGKMSANKV